MAIVWIDCKMERKKKVRENKKMIFKNQSFTNYGGKIVTGKKKGQERRKERGWNYIHSTNRTGAYGLLLYTYLPFSSRRYDLDSL